MERHSPYAARAAVAQTFTEDLLRRCGVSPGMRVAVLGEGACELALLVAERVGDSGAVVAVDGDAERVRLAARRAEEQCFEGLTLAVGDARTCAAKAPYDALIGRFYLADSPDPVCELRDASALLVPGGRMLFIEWHLDSLAFAQSSTWPEHRGFRAAAARALVGLRRSGRHTDMGLRLPNAFAEAGLPLPASRVELRAVTAGCDAGLDVVRDILRSAGPAAGTIVHDLVGEGGHAFLPLLVGAWTRIPG